MIPHIMLLHHTHKTVNIVVSRILNTSFLPANCGLCKESCLSHCIVIKCNLLSRGNEQTCLKFLSLFVDFVLLCSALW
jgi:hypothetical protein